MTRRTEKRLLLWANLLTWGALGYLLLSCVAHRAPQQPGECSVELVEEEPFVILHCPEEP